MVVIFARAVKRHLTFGTAMGKPYKNAEMVFALEGTAIVTTFGCSARRYIQRSELLPKM